MKKGTAVKFIGTENREPVEKTYIWAIQKVSPIETIYLIEHPQGVLFNEATKKDFDGYDTSKLHEGKRYMAANAHELIDLTTKEETNTEIKNTELEIITVKMPKIYFEQVKDFLTSQKEQLQSNEFMALLQMNKTEFNQMLKFYDDLIFDTNFALAQQNNSQQEEIKTPTENV